MALPAEGCVRATVRIQNEARDTDLGTGARDYTARGRDGARMNLACADQIAKAVLYEGYMLYPYRPSSVKNRQRFNFGMLYPPSYGEAHEEASSILTECLIEAQANPILEVRFRFLHLRPQSGGSDATKNGWQVAVEREV